MHNVFIDYDSKLNVIKIRTSVANTCPQIMQFLYMHFVAKQKEGIQYIAPRTWYGD